MVVCMVFVQPSDLRYMYDPYTVLVDLYGHVSQGRSTPCIGDGHPTFNDGNPYNGYINPYYWVDDHPLLYGNNGSLDPSTCRYHQKFQVPKMEGFLIT